MSSKTGTDPLLLTQYLQITGGTVTVSTPIFTCTQAWNAGAVTFKLDTATVTDTASAAASLLRERIVGATTVESLDKNGNLIIGKVSAAPYLSVGGQTNADPVGSGGASLMLSGSGGYSVLYLNSTAADAGGAAVGTVNFRAPNSASASAGRIAAVSADTQGTTATNRGGTLVLQTKADAGTLTTALQIDNQQRFTVASGFLFKNSAGAMAIRNTADNADAALTAAAGTFSGVVAVGNTVNVVSPTAPNRTVTISVGGVTLYLAAKTTND